MKNDKRQDHFSWDETFMQICRVIAQRSKDPNTQNGACIVNKII
jgi:dCMP deaminase